MPGYCVGDFLQAIGKIQVDAFRRLVTHERRKPVDVDIGNPCVARFKLERHFNLPVLIVRPLSDRKKLKKPRTLTR